ncbi:MAG: hypothetical protein KAR31_05790, partial [Candidatus Omnitrophica bacterium]|nr:hypothetical protein [Candidatus Omnitrophota bacterium]
MQFLKNKNCSLAMTRKYGYLTQPVRGSDSVLWSLALPAGRFLGNDKSMQTLGFAYGNGEIFNIPFYQ